MPDRIDIVILSKAFLIRHNRSNSLKSRFVGMFHKRFRVRVETFWALRDINLTIEAGESFGIIGRNGSGKSTLLRMIAGIYPPTWGEIRMPKNTRVGAMIELGVGFHPELTGRENVFLGASIHGLCRKEIEAVAPTFNDPILLTSHRRVLGIRRFHGYRDQESLVRHACPSRFCARDQQS